ncbi:MAG: hypothetical protein PHI48_09795 [Bacteroidales bacterium]|nr:hypothetical protein [Bacteroidales bacterium]
MIQKICSAALLWSLSMCMIHAQFNTQITLKKPGNGAKTYQLTAGENGILKPEKEIPVEVIARATTNGDKIEYRVTVAATEDIWFNLSNSYVIEGSNHAANEFYLPGFWYKKNLRSPKQAPNFTVSDSWTVREDRLSTPLSAVYETGKGDYFTVTRKGKWEIDALTTHSTGEQLLSNESHVGYVGFGKQGTNSELRFGMPAWEAPYAYTRKLTLSPEVRNFLFLQKGATRMYTWEITKGKASDFATFIQKSWQYSFDTYNPSFVENKMTNDEVKHLLAQFYVSSYLKTDKLSGFSGEGLSVEKCEVVPRFEVGFVGRILLNAFNCLEYGEQLQDYKYTHMSEDIFNSYLANGFNKEGFMREYWTPTGETDVYSIRRQAEGAYAMLLFLKYERDKGKKFPEWEQKIRTLMDNLVTLQNKDHSFPRKFKADKSIVDSTGGSTATAIPTLTMAASYFKDKKYMKAAEKAAVYLEKEIVAKSDYFSSTLDANCEDKEASYYAATAFYYLALNSKGEQLKHYTALARQSAYFAASWYYLWDVPFSWGQMLGDMGFKTRGWGNVSVENNHVDAYVFDLLSVFEWLSKTSDEPRFAMLSTVIRTSMHEQLLPYPDNMHGVGKVGYHPEVIQHTNWDYGKNGKGYYNDIFAPGWVTTSLWQMLVPDRAAGFFQKK